MITFSSASPIYIQIIEEIKREIVSGVRQPGSRVETVREMAQEIGVNPNTVQKAFAELEREGLMYSERTSGRYITTDVDLIKKVKEESIVSTIAEFVNLMKRSGFNNEDILRLVSKYLEEGRNNG